MASSLSHRALAAALGKLQQEKEERVQKASKDEREKLDKETTEKKKELEELERKKQKFEDESKKETEDLERLKESIQDQVRQAADEQLFFTLQRRIIEFQGADTATLRQRLITEGYGEQLITDMLKLRTLEQLLDRGGSGMPVSFVQDNKDNVKENPLERIMQGNPRLYDMTDRRVLDQLEGMREQAFEKGYLSQQEQQFVSNVAYFANRFEQNDTYREKDAYGYLTRTSEVADSIRKHLGLDTDTNTLTYAGKKL